MDEFSRNLCFYLSLRGVNANPVLIKEHSKASLNNGFKKISGVAKAIGYKAKQVKLKRVNSLNVPIMVELDDYGSCVIVRIHSGVAHIYQARQPQRPLVIGVEELFNKWNCEGVRLTKFFSGEDHPFTIIRSLFSRKAILSIGLATLIVQVLGFSVPIFSQIVIDKVVVHHNFSALNVFGTLMFAMILGELLFSLARVAVSTAVGERIDLTIGASVYSMLLSKPLAFYQAGRVGELVGLARKSDFVKNLLITGGFFNMLDLVFVSVFLILMMYYNLKLTLLCAVLLIVIVAVNALHFLLRERLLRRQSDLIEPTTILTEALHGIETVKLAALEGVVLKKIDGALISKSKHSSEVTKKSNNLAATNICLQRVGSLAILWYGASLVLSGDMTMGQLIAFQMMSSRLFHPAARMTHTLYELKKAKTDLTELGDRLFSEQAVGSLMTESVGDIQIRELGFRFGQRSRPVLNNLMLDVPKGAKIGIVGESGIGKSTLLKILANVYKPQVGSVNVDGVDLRQLNEELFRNKVKLVPQSAFLFAGTVIENVAPLGQILDAKKLTDLVNILSLQDFITSDSEGLVREVAEGGRNLSGGQKQKLCLLRALLSCPDVLLLDEATSAIDEKMEMEIHRRIIDSHPEMTMVTVSHRINSLSDYDVIYRLINGKLILMPHPTRTIDYKQVELGNA